MRLMAPTKSYLKSWVQHATLYQKAARIVRAIAPDQVDTIAPSFDAYRAAIEAEAEVLVGIYGQGTKAAQKRVAELIPIAWSEVLVNSSEPFAETWTEPTGLGVTPIKPTTFKIVVQYAKWIGGGLIALWGFVNIGMPLMKSIKDLTKTAAEKAQAQLNLAVELEKIRLQLVQGCSPGDQGCVDRYNRLIDSASGLEEDCGLLDTPTGTGLGGIGGLLIGYVGAESVLGWVE